MMISATAFETYQQLRVTGKLAQQNLETAEMYQDAMMEWSLLRRMRSVGTQGRARTILATSCKLN